MVDHSGIEKKFPSYFKSFELPEGAIEKSLIVYRACRTQKVERDSFLPSYEEIGIVKSNDLSDAGNYSLSVYWKPNDVKRFAKLNGNYNPPWSIAKGKTESCCGIIQITRERTMDRNSHVDWWLYEKARPHEHFILIDDFDAYYEEYKQKR